MNEANQFQTHSEFIAIGKDVYRTNGNAPWEKVPPNESLDGFSLAQNAQLPDVLKFDFSCGDLKFIRRETLQGAGFPLPM